ncbi:MAG: ester cyclase [Halobacteria archaeon]|nr:ester cyclase [Halobacteria archaeon]
MAKQAVKDTNVQIVRDFMETIFVEKNLDMIDEYVAEDYVEYNTAFPEIQGIENAREIWEGVFSAFPDLKITEVELISDDNVVVYVFRTTATHEGTLEPLGLEPTNETFEVENVAIWWIENGKLSEGRVYLDTFGMMQQLGIVEQ